MLKRLSKWVEGLGYKVLIFDTKETTHDYEGFGSEVPVVMRETTDSFILIGLLESMFRRRLTPYYATLDRLTTGAKSKREMICKAQELEQTAKSGFIKDAARSLYRLLERLESETEKIKTVPNLQLNEGINKMVINQFSPEAQQLIVKYAFDDALTVYKGKLVLVLDEAYKFIPQGYSSAATRSVMNVMTQGAKTGLFTWIGTQFLATTDKDPLKACAFKFLGTQDHPTEVKHTLDLVPEARGRFTGDDIMNLKLGHFILVRKRPRDVRTVYVAPVGVPSDMARDVAKGLVSPEKVKDFIHAKDLFKENGDEEMYKEKYEQLVGEIRILKAELEDTKTFASPEHVAKIQTELDESKKYVAKIQKELDESKSIIELRGKQLERMREEHGGYQLKVEEDRRGLIGELELFTKLKDVLKSIVPTAIKSSGKEVELPSGIDVGVEQPPIHVTYKKVEPLKLDGKDLLGRIAILYSEGYFNDKEWFSVADIVRGFEPRNWERDPRVSRVLDHLTSLRYLLKKMAGNKPIYHFILKSEEAKSKGLLKVEEV